MKILDRILRRKAPASKPADTQPVLDLLDELYGADVMADMRQLLVDSSGEFLLLTCQHDAETLDARSYIAYRVFPYAVWHQLCYIQRDADGAPVKLFPSAIKIIQSHSADLRADEAPLSWVHHTVTPDKPVSLRAGLDQPQRPTVPHGGQLMEPRDVRWLGMQLKAVGDLLPHWNKVIAKWWTSDERQHLIERATEWSEAVNAAEPQVDYARTLKRLGEIGITPKVGDVTVASNDHSLHRIGPDGVNIERMGDGVFEDVEIEQKVSYQLGTLLAFMKGPTHEDLARAREIVRETLGLDESASIYLIHSDYSGTVESTVDARAERALARAEGE